MEKNTPFSCNGLLAATIIRRQAPGRQRRRKEPHRAARLLARFRPEYALVPGEKARLKISDGLRYARVQYFPASGFKDFSLLKRE